MFIYNVTITLEDSIHNEWLKWMKEVHIPDVMRTELFIDNKICKLITEELETTYAIQYTFREMEDLNKYQKEFAAKLQQEHKEKFKDKFAAFRTILEII
jgi:DNA-directed RNA polymerase beta' subunit